MFHLSHTYDEWYYVHHMYCPIAVKGRIEILVADLTV